MIEIFQIPTGDARSEAVLTAKRGHVTSTKVQIHKALRFRGFFKSGLIPIAM
jgi:hypothetical protein